MVKYGNENSDNLPHLLFDAVKEMVMKNEYPEWNNLPIKLQGVDSIFRRDDD
jgi:hypothetical protein